MPYDPLRYVQPRTGIRAGFGAMGQALTQMPGEIRAEREYEYLQEQRRIAVEEAKKNWGEMEDTWKVLKKQYGKMVQPLLESNQMTFDEYSSNLNMIPKPTQADKKNPDQYIDRLSQAYGSVIKDAKKRIRTQQVAPQVQEAVVGKQLPEREVTQTTGYQETAPAARAEGAAKGYAEGAPPGQYVSGEGQPAARGFSTYQPEFQKTALPAMQEPAARTREEASQRLPSDITATEAEQVPAYKELSTGLQIQKQKSLDEYRKKMLAKGFGEDEWDKVKWKYEYMQDERARDSRTELSLEDDKRMLKQFENQVKKSGQLDMNELDRAQEMGIDLQTIQTGGDDLLVEIRELQKSNDIRISEQRQKSQDTENTLKELDQNPYTPIGKLRESGRKTVYEGQEGRQLSQKLGMPPAVGGRKQIGGRQSVGGTQKPAETIQKKRGGGF